MRDFGRSLLRTYGRKVEERKNGDDSLVFVPENHCPPGTDYVA